MKLQFKLALYNALTKLAIILFTGMLILFSLERISYHHIALRLLQKKAELMNQISSKEIAAILNQQKSYVDYNLLQEEYINIKPLKYAYDTQNEDIFSTEPRT